MGLERKVGGSIGSSNGHSARSPLVLLLALAALVLYLSVPALKELRAVRTCVHLSMLTFGGVCDGCLC